MAVEALNEQDARRAAIRSGGVVAGRSYPLVLNADHGADRTPDRIAEILQVQHQWRRREFWRCHPIVTIAAGIWGGWVLITATVLLFVLFVVVLGGNLANNAFGGRSPGNPPPTFRAR